MDEIRIIEREGEKWVVAKDICRVLGLQNVTRMTRNIPKTDLKIVRVPTETRGEHDSLVLNISGLKKVLSRSRGANIPELLSFLKEEHDLDLCLDIVYPFKEVEAVRIISECFKQFEFQTQFSVGKYRIDLYFPEHRIAVECDEENHSDYKKENEKKRESFIKDELGCQFVRFNPDEKNFNIGTVINKLMLLLYKNPVKLPVDPNPSRKTCIICHEDLPIKFFGEHSTSADGHRLACIACLEKKPDTEEKTCGCCKEIKPMADYTKYRHSADGFSFYCRPCSAKKNKKYRETARNKEPKIENVEEKECYRCRETKPAKEFWVNKYAPDKLNYQCKSCCQLARKSHTKSS